jgi:hypothetical protein
MFKRNAVQENIDPKSFAFERYAKLPDPKKYTDDAIAITVKFLGKNGDYFVETIEKAPCSKDNFNNYIKSDSSSLKDNDDKVINKELIYNSDGKINEKAIEMALSYKNLNKPSDIYNKLFEKNLLSQAEADAEAEAKADAEAEAKAKLVDKKGGYDANKKSRSVGSKRKTIRHAKRPNRRSRHSRLYM